MPRENLVKRLAEDLTRAEEQRHEVDAAGRSIRPECTARYQAETISEETGEIKKTQHWLWGNLHAASAEHLHLSFMQRRDASGADVKAMRRDQLSANEFNPNLAGDPIEVQYDFWPDAKEVDEEPPAFWSPACRASISNRNSKTGEASCSRPSV